MNIALSVCLHADVTIFIVPKATVDTVWVDEINAVLKDKVKIWASTHGKKLTLDCDYYVFHYEALPLAIYLAKHLNAKKPFIGIDESHNFNEISSMRTLRLIELTRALHCQHTDWASGTPVKAIGREMIPLLKSIDDMFTPDVEARFKMIYGASANRANDILRNRLGLISHKIDEMSYMSVPPPKEIQLKVRIPNGEQFTNENIKKEMRKYMEEKFNFYQANMKKYLAVYDQCISIYERTVRSSTEREELRKYKEYVAIIIKGYVPREHKDIAHFCKSFERTKIMPSLPSPALRAQFKDAISVVKYAQMKVLGESLGMLDHKRSECAGLMISQGVIQPNPDIDCTTFADIVHNADKKTIVFSSHIGALVAADNYFKKEGFKTLQVHGEHTKNLVNIVNQYKQDPNANPLITTFQSLSASQTLIVANTMLYLNNPFREYINSQAFHRMFRIGQDVQTFLIVCSLDTREPNISTRSDEILAWSKAMAESIMGTSLSDKDMDGIVRRLHLNPPSSFETAIRLFRDILHLG